MRRRARAYDDRRPRRVVELSVPNSLPLRLAPYRLRLRIRLAACVAPADQRLKRGKEHPERMRNGSAGERRRGRPVRWFGYMAQVSARCSPSCSLIERIRARDFAVLVTVRHRDFRRARRTAPAARRAASVRSARRAALCRPLPRPLAAGPRPVRRIRSVAESDLVRGRRENSDDPRQWPAVRALVQPLAAFCQARSRRLLTRFDLCLAQSAADAERFGELGAPRVGTTGNLKLDAPAPPADSTQDADRSRAAIGKRPVIVAASTHPGEESAIIDAHRRLHQNFPAC